MPFIVGIQHKTNDIRQRTQHITRLNAYKDEIKIMGGIVATAPNWHELREKLRPIHAHPPGCRNAGVLLGFRTIGEIFKAVRGIR